MFARCSIYSVHCFVLWQCRRSSATMSAFCQKTNAQLWKCPNCRLARLCRVGSFIAETYPHTHHNCINADDFWYSVVAAHLPLSSSFHPWHVRLFVFCPYHRFFYMCALSFCTLMISYEIRMYVCWMFSLRRGTIFDCPSKLFAIMPHFPSSFVLLFIFSRLL